MFFAKYIIYALPLFSSSHAEVPADLCVNETKKLNCSITYRAGEEFNVQEVAFDLHKDTSFFCPDGVKGNTYAKDFKIANSPYLARIYTDYYFMRLEVLEMSENNEVSLAEAISIPPQFTLGMNLYSSVSYTINSGGSVLILCTSQE